MFRSNSRLPGVGRGPESLKSFKPLDSGFRRNDGVTIVFLILFVTSTTWALEPTVVGSTVSPFGVMIDRTGILASQRMALAEEWGVRYFRPADLNLRRWKGRKTDAELMRNSGLQLILTVRNGGRPRMVPPIPSSPPKNLAQYETEIGEVLDHFKPILLVVENEENSTVNYSGSPTDYERQLIAACSAAHWRGVPCANGGLRTSFVTALVWDAYRQKGKNEKAVDYIQRACTTRQRNVLTEKRSQRRVDKALAQGRALLEAYKKAGIDYVNFHWTMPDAEAFEETVRFLEEAVGKPVITNELGLFKPTPEALQKLAEKALELNLRYVVWASVESRNTRAFHNRKGTWRSGGEALRDFFRDTFTPSPLPSRQPEEL